MLNINSLFPSSSKAKDIPASLAHSDPIPSESVLLNFVKFHNTSLGWIVCPS